jgi:SAM-dependent methyltransferase
MGRMLIFPVNWTVAGLLRSFSTIQNACHYINQIPILCVVNNRTMDYSAIKLSEADIQNQGYKQYLGGGKEHWQNRGAFQLYFLQKMGMKPHDRLLDAGCGPLRSGVHFIHYLDRGHYSGIDVNPDFIRVAGETVAQDPVLREKAPVLEHVENFEFSRLNGTFTYVMAFSVLNHCDAQMRRMFFEKIVRVTRPETKIYLTHGHWYQDSLLDGTGLRLKRSIASAREIAPDLDMQNWGWPPKESIFPIVEVVRQA